MRSPAVRLAITLLLPLLLVIGADTVLLPGMEDLFGSMMRKTGVLLFARSNMSVFALGITPVIEAYGVVELAAFLVPRWQRLRHGNPEGRAKLDRASRVVTVVFAAFQAFGVSQSIAALDNGTGSMSMAADLPSMPVVVATLVGGVCVQIVAAEIVSRQGIANGYILITVVQSIAGLRVSVLAPIQYGLRVGTFETKHFVLLFVVLTVPAVATWMALRGGDRVRAVAPVESGAAGPYRAARALAVSPWVPVPASAFAPFPLAGSLLAMPLVLVLGLGIRGPARELAESLEHPIPTAIGLLVITTVLTLFFAAQLHRPREMADVASRVGFAGGEELASKAREALNAAILPTLLFFATLLCAQYVSGGLPAHPTVLFVPLLVALVMDMAVSLRATKLVPVWQERRASAVPVVRAVLAAEGIEATVRGLSVLSLLQVFAPYAAAELLVPAEDAARATSLLRHVFLGEKRPETDAATEALRTDVVAVPWKPARRVLGLAGTTAVVLLAIAASNLLSRPTETAKGPRARLELVRVDDEVDVFAAARDDELPTGVEVRFENVPLGPGKTAKRYFARTTMGEGETYEKAFRRMRAWCDQIALPEGKRLGLEAVEDYDPDTNKTTRTGVRTFVITGPSILTSDDVVDAMPSVDQRSGMPETYVAITLSPDAAERFRSATAGWIQRRIAIVVDDEIVSAPVVKAEIGGGRLSITMGASADEDLQLLQAKALARSLTGGK